MVNGPDEHARIRRIGEEELARSARRKMLEDLRRSGKKGNFIVVDDDHDVDDANRDARIAREFEQMDGQMIEEMRRDGIDLATMDIERDEEVEDEDGIVHIETDEKEVDVEVIDMRLDEGLRDFLREDVRDELFGKDGPPRRGDVDRLTQCPRCGSTDIQTLSPPNMYCNSCDQTYSYEMGMEDVERQFDVRFERGAERDVPEDGQIIFGKGAAGPRKIRRVFRPGDE